MTNKMEGQSEKHKVSIFAETFTIVSDEGKAAVNELVQNVDDLMQDISQKFKNKEPKLIAILAAIEFAHRLDCLKKEMNQKNKAEARLMSIVDSELLSNSV